LIIGLASDEQGRTQLTTFFAWLDKWPKHVSSLPAEAIRRADKLLEGMVEAFKPEIRLRIEEKLREQFGVTRLGKPPKSLDGLIAKVLKSGRIRSNDDARLVEEFVDNTTNIEVIGADSYYRLAGILDRYQGKAPRPL